ncbi:hypothetical protein Dsin_016999 [Dipteronia sinensis]|uniref:Uncharacterized protein n=1 Tax=Dipteronia sinensis TaxID=43782 RepID=A0AAE0AF38_9ROSI|nr:hypothetical protein Dsin_016999 [Dipteronia sinensis]
MKTSIFYVNKIDLYNFPFPFSLSLLCRFCKLANGYLGELSAVICQMTFLSYSIQAIPFETLSRLILWIRVTASDDTQGMVWFAFHPYLLLGSVTCVNYQILVILLPQENVRTLVELKSYFL